MVLTPVVPFSSGSKDCDDDRDVLKGIGSESHRVQFSKLLRFTFSKISTWVLVIFLAASAGVATWRAATYEDQNSAGERKAYEAVAVDVADTLRRQVQTSMSSLYAFASMIEVDGGVWLDQHFVAIAETVLLRYRGISNFDIAPFAVVKYKVPLKGNEGAIGHAMFSDPNRINATLATVRAGKALLDGPLKLMQGGQAVIARYPVFTSYSPVSIPDIRSWWPTWNNTCCTTSLPLPGYGAESLPGPLDASNQTTYFWGLVEFVSKMDKLVEDLKLDVVATRLSFQFRNRKPHPSMSKDGVFMYSANIGPGGTLTNPVVVPISLPEIDIDWEFVAVPKRGWSSVSTLMIVTMVSVYGGLVISVLSFMLMELKSFQLQCGKALVIAKVMQLSEKQMDP